MNRLQRGVTGLFCRIREGLYAFTEGLPLITLLLFLFSLPAASQAQAPNGAPDQAAAQAATQASGDTDTLPGHNNDLLDAGDGKLRVVVLDPGHGGVDTGAIAPTGRFEKDLTLTVAKRLKVIIEESLDIKVLLTRDDDRYLTLDERAVMANEVSADVFVSIHANAAVREGASGVETYFLSFDASDDDARMVAAFENDVIGLPVAEENTESSDDLKAILWDLTQTRAHKNSSTLAEAVQISLADATGSPNRGIKQAHFKVLVGATMPAILIEVGFLSNHKEESKLFSERYQRKVTKAIAKGIGRFEQGEMKKTASLKKREGI